MGRSSMSQLVVCLAHPILSIFNLNLSLERFTKFRTRKYANVL